MMLDLADPKYWPDTVLEVYERMRLAAQNCAEVACYLAPCGGWMVAAHPWTGGKFLLYKEGDWYYVEDDKTEFVSPDSDPRDVYEMADGWFDD